MNDDFNTETDDENGGNEWLATYGDLVTLLLCFFVLLFAMSTVDAQKYESIVASFSGGSSIGVNSGGDTIVDFYESQNSTKNDSNTKDKDDINKIYEEVKKMLAVEKLENNIKIKKSKNGVFLTLKNDLLFDNGKAALRPDVKKTLRSFAHIFKKYDREIRIEGHTDNLPIRNSFFESNWELSTARAISVVKYFTEKLPQEERIAPNKFEVAGLGEHEPVARNDTEENRQKNRRIEIVILK
ncbi:flagellar motor protein MotB [Clostridium oryzae]|uniref:Motility protein B n=1 Tax=Clostridium oryzae TaxID=1450648 RepID=A0A1V4I4H0_9CLOT|nr:flagellar motor protein MotB [Clostridium oryzae]OPJ54770.1 motility protein B [Clostridium oryzae]